VLAELGCYRKLLTRSEKARLGVATPFLKSIAHSDAPRGWKMVHVHG
jgi:hypothetical protein